MNIFSKKSKFFSAILFVSLCTYLAPSIAKENQLIELAKYTKDCFVSAKNKFVSTITPNKASTESLSDFLKRQAILTCIIGIIPLIRIFVNNSRAKKSSENMNSFQEALDINEKNKYIKYFGKIAILYSNFLGIYNLPGYFKLLPPAITYAAYWAYKNRSGIAKKLKKACKKGFSIARKLQLKLKTENQEKEGANFDQEKEDTKETLKS